MQSLATCGVRFTQPNSLADGLDKFGANKNGINGRTFVNLSKDLRCLPFCVAERRGPSSRIKVFAQDKTSSEDGREIGIQDDSDKTNSEDGRKIGIQDDLVSLHKDQGPTVTVKFVLEKKCKFGQQFHVVGDAPQFGSWNPKAAVPLEWSEGDIWTKEVDVPVGKQIEYKFILIGKRGELLWQPGPNRAFEASGHVASVVVSSEWELDEILSEAGNEKEVCEATEMEITGQGIGNENSAATLVEGIFSDVISGLDAVQTGNVISDPPNGALGSSAKQTEDNTQKKGSVIDLSGPPDAPGLRTERNEE